MTENTIVTWKPNAGRQTIALTRSEKEILYGGARGGGKTDAGLAWMVDPAYINHPAYAGLVIRRNADDLSDWIARAHRFYMPIGATIAGNPPVIKFPKGCFIRTGHLKDQNAYEKYLGHEYQKMLVEELTQIPRESDFEDLISSNRSTIPGLPAQVFATTNPGGPGHVWVKGRFVDVANMKTFVVNPQDSEEKQITRIFIPSTMDDNPILKTADPQYVAKIENIKDPKKRAAWRDGSWDTFSGQFFEKWSPEKHIIPDLELSPYWHRYRGIDWGYSAPACCLWIAVDFEGNHYIYRELYIKNQTPRQFAKKVIQMTDRAEKIVGTYADPSIWAKNQYGRGENNDQATTKSIAQLFEECGLFCSQGNNDRQSGWQALRDILYWDENIQPKLYVVSNCEEFIRSFPQLVYDDHKGKYEDVNTLGDDHAADALRYAVMHTTMVHSITDPATLHEKYINSITRPEETAGAWDQDY